MYFVIFVLLTGGLFSVVSQLAGIPPGATAKGIHIAVRKEQSLKEYIYTLFVMPFAKTVSPLIHIADFKRKRISGKLARAGINMTPEEYLARSLIMSGTVFIISFLMLNIAMKNMSFIAVILACLVFFNVNNEVNDKLKDKDKLIEKELPKFIRAIVQGLKSEKDIIKLLSTYQTISGDGLKYDIEVLIMDLKSGNFEDGFIEFDKRVGNAYVSRLSKALIAVSRGDNQDSTLNYLLSDMGTLAKEMMQRELNKRPGKIKMLVIPIVVMAVIALFYTIGVNLFSSLSGIM